MKRFTSTKAPPGTMTDCHTFDKASTPTSSEANTATAGNEFGGPLLA